MKHIRERLPGYYFLFIQKLHNSANHNPKNQENKQEDRRKGKCFFHKIGTEQLTGIARHQERQQNTETYHDS
ncbi:hypothetical protein [Pontibacter sp. FD36]|uniref:hypothetical protein n=1 Tax=Pontibacter sp. FD36 TaxID=2789860 RepID=UPI0018AC5AE8|nr:hypothetical protein [Pontibacter sp. FD36]